MDPNKKRKIRSDKGVPKKRRPSKSTTTSGLISRKIRPDELASDGESDVSLRGPCAKQNSPTTDVELVKLTAEKALRMPEIMACRSHSGDDLSSLPSTPLVGKSSSSSAPSLDAKTQKERSPSIHPYKHVTANPTDINEQQRSSTSIRQIELASSPAPSRVVEVNSEHNAPHSSKPNSGSSKHLEAMQKKRSSDENDSARPTVASSQDAAASAP